LGQTEAYVEYTRDGRVLKGMAKAPTRTKYEEDVYLNNHTSVFGSYYSRVRGHWGYGCCHSLMKNSYCTGDAGRIANDSANGTNIDTHQAKKMIAIKSQTEKDKAIVSQGAIKRSDLFGDSTGGAGLDDLKVKEAVKKEEEWSKRDHSAEGDDRKRGYNSMTTIDVSLEDMEAYRLKKNKREDPMDAFADR
jgi:pre-mRNA-processing factor SLU7